MDPIVIVGTGLAGYTVAREFRKLDTDTPLVMLSTDDGGFYSKPMLSNALALGKTAADLQVTPAEQMSTQLSAHIRAFTQVHAIAPAAKRLMLDNEPLSYSRLVLALGADPIRLSLVGSAAHEVLSVNDRADYARFRARIEGKRHIALLGGGLIGCEFANDLIGAGYEVTVIDLAPHPLGRLVPAEVGTAVRDALAAVGVTWRLNTSVKSVDHADERLAVMLSDGTQLSADVVLSAIGLRPRIQSAAAAGLAVNRGIVTDRFLATSVTDIYALGDCAEIEGLLLPFVMPLMHGARALAKTLAGDATALSYPAMPVVVKTPACPLVVAPPPAQAQGRWESTVAGANVRAVFYGDGGAILGFALTGTAVADKQSLAKTLPPLLT